MLPDAGRFAAACRSAFRYDGVSRFAVRVVLDRQVAPLSSPPPQSAPEPVLKETRFDLVSSSMMALVIGLGLSVVWLTVVWLTNRLPTAAGPVPVELIEVAGGSEDGAIDETLLVESPEEISDDPSVAETFAEETEIQEVLDNVLELSDQAANLAQQQFETDSRNAGTPGSATGTGRRALGMGPGEGGFPREQRWFVRFASEGTLDEYARQLEFFGIELAALFPSGEMIYLSDLSSPNPRKRSVNSGKGESRMYMTWRGGDRKQGDMKLFGRAKVDVRGATILHFYPQQTEAMLAQLEHSYRNRPADQIRRTYFTVVGSGTGYEFRVTRQTFLQ